MKFTKEQVEIIYELDSGEYEGFGFVKDLPTEGGGEKYQTLKKIFSFEGKKYLSKRTMSGSYFSDFDREEACEKEFSEVEEREMTKTAWVFTETGKEV